MSTTEEELQTLPVGHPQAGYYGSDPTGSDHAGTLPPVEQAWADDRDAAWQAQVDAVQANEHAVATAPPPPEADAEATSTKTSKSKSSSDES